MNLKPTLGKTIVSLVVIAIFFFYVYSLNLNIMCGAKIGMECPSALKQILSLTGLSEIFLPGLLVYIIWSLLQKIKNKKH